MSDLPITMVSGGDPTARSRWKLWLVLVMAAFFAISVYFHRFHLNSHYYHTWAWRRLPGWPTYLMFGAASVPFFAGQYLAGRRRNAVPLALVTISMSLLMLAGALAQRTPPNLDHITAVEGGWNTGYFQAAQILQGVPVKQWLSQYPRMAPFLGLHPRTKPPGLILFETALIDLLGPDPGTALVAGLIVGLAAILSVWATYSFILFFGKDERAAFYGASYFALCAGPVLFFPDFDQIYPIVTLAVTVLWALSLEKDRLHYSAALGIVYAAATFFTYLPGVLAFFLIGYAWLGTRHEPRWRITRIIKHAAAALAVFGFVYLMLWALTGFNPITTFIACIHQVGELWEGLVKTGAPARHLPGTIPADLYDFALGSGWISYLLAGFYLASAANGKRDARTKIVLLGLAQIVFVAFAGLIQGETSRLWIFLLPMLMMPVGLELSKWEKRPRLAVYAVLLILTVMIEQSMTFFYLFK
jgi:hypothetical protein